MDELEYITHDALIMCDQGGAPDFFKPDFNTTVKIHDCLVATNMDAKPLVNIPSFKVCKITGGPCTPVTVPGTWQDTWTVKVKGQTTLIGKSTCVCTAGGKIEFMTSGQVPLPEDAAAEVKALQDQAQRELDDSGHGNSVGETGFVEGMIPVWGSGKDLINDIQTGDVGGAVLNGAFLVWDVVSIGVGIFTFGGGTVAMQGAKAGVKGAIKAGAKALSKEALQGLGKAAFKKLSKEALQSSIDDVAKKLMKTCVFACFPAGTPVHTEHGAKNIENITAGDKVWAFNEDTGEIALQEVVHIMERETDHTLELITDTETIETTALHPFYVNGAWRDASELQIGDKIITKDNSTVEIKQTRFRYEPKKVFNFEVAHWHTYFVGVLAWLVHNAGRCLKEISDRLKYLGRTPGKNSKTGREVFERMKNEVPPTAREYIDEFGDTVKEFWDSGNKVWRDIKEADMGHIHDAVKWWNDVAVPNGYKPKGPEVREWMLKSDNYILEYFSSNRSKGAILSQSTNYIHPIK